MFIAIIIIGVIGLVAFFYINENFLYPQKIKNIKKLMEEKNYEDALKIINTLPDSKKETPDLQFATYEIYMSQGQYFMALFHLSEILKRGNYTATINEKDIHMKMANVYEIMQKNKKALSEYYAVLKIDTDDYPANLRAGEILFQMKNFGTAQPYLEKALDLNAEHAPTCRNLGEIYLINQDHAKALAMAESCLALGDKASEVYLTRGKAHLAMGKYQECISDMEEVMSDPVNSPMANIIKAIAASRLGETERAKDLFSQSLIKFNESYQDLILEARYEYALILANEGAVKDALRQLYLIRNAGVSYKDTTHRIAIFSQVVNSRLISDILEDDAESMIKNHLSKGLATVSHVIMKTVFPDPRSAYILTRKNASGQNIKQALGLDLNMRETPDNFLTNFLDFLEKQELSSGVLFSLFGFSEATVEALDKAKYELTLYNLKDFESLLKGEKPL